MVMIYIRFASIQVYLVYCLGLLTILEAVRSRGFKGAIVNYPVAAKGIFLFYLPD